MHLGIGVNHAIGIGLLYIEDFDLSKPGGGSGKSSVCTGASNIRMEK
jgi:hypothetical protein